MSYSRHHHDQHGAPSTEDDIYAFLDAYPTLSTQNKNVMLVDYEWTMKYDRYASAIGAVPSAKLAKDSFVFNMLLSPHTFFVVVDNPMLYKRHYPLIRSIGPGQYTHTSEDSPRGLLQYNEMHTIPFVIYSNTQQRQHNFSTGYTKNNLDVYKTAINPPGVPSPLYDLKHDRPSIPAELLEIFSA